MNSVLFCPPTYFDVIDVKNPFMQSGSPVDRKAACEEWERVRAAFHDAGLQLETVEAVPGLEDMVFANNQVFVGATREGKRFIVPSRMRHPSRAREVPHFVRWFRQRGYDVLDLDLDAECLEGHGDLLWHIYPDGSTPASPAASHRRPLVWAGFGFRSTRIAVERFQRAMRERDIEVVPLALADERFYHLDTCLAPLTADSVLIYPPAFSPEALAEIRSRCRAHEVTEQEALAFMCNGVAARGRFITPALTPRLHEILATESLTPVLVPTPEFQKSGGSVCCLKLFLPS